MSIPTNLNETCHLLTETETANVLSLKVATLRRWRWEGKGPQYLKIGNAVRYDPAVIERYIEESRRSSTSQAHSQPNLRSAPSGPDRDPSTRS